jgi:formate C-acetyltransferase
MQRATDDIREIRVTDRIRFLKEKTLSEKRYLSLDQAEIITRIYRENPDDPVIIKRAKALAASLREIPLKIDPLELIVGNRTPGIRAGVIFPEAGISWLAKEIETIDSRPQDPFYVNEDDIDNFLDVIEPFWRGKTLEDDIYSTAGPEIRSIEKVVKINQKDHAQGHICPDVAKWLESGPAGLIRLVQQKLNNDPEVNRDFYRSVLITLNAACDFMRRYATIANEMAAKSKDPDVKRNLEETANICQNISSNPPYGFREAVQSVWFLFVILHMESNASSFSPGRMDQYLLKYYESDISEGKIDDEKALEIIDALFIKFNQIVYLRNSQSARYFAGFPTGFNIALGGQTSNGKDATNRLSYLFLKAQDHIRLPQPNLTARLHRSSPDEFLRECTRIISLGTGMPQIVNDESIIPSLTASGVSYDDAIEYALVGCVELSTQGNFLGWSDAAMFNLVKVLELTLNNGTDMLTGEQTGLKTGSLTDYANIEDLEQAYAKQIDFFVDKMTRMCLVVEKKHQEHLPSPFLSSVINNCLETGIDVTAGGAKYNFSGIQAIQAANVADSLEALDELVFEKKVTDKKRMLEALRTNFRGYEILRQICINKVPKYGNDLPEVDERAAKWLRYFAHTLSRHKNYRGGRFNLGLYTVSAHIPMGQNVAATPDGRLAGSPLADGGVSPMYGRDKEGPTAVLNSVSRLPFILASNGSLLNMKFLPSFFKTETDRETFCSFLRAFVELKIHHIQFNVVKSEDLLKAKADPESFRGLTIRVAGYTAYFTELAEDLQNEIIQRTTHGEI